MLDKMNLSRIIVLVKSEHLDEVIDAINASEDYEYHLHDEKGRIIVTIEGENTEHEISRLKKLRAIPNVIDAEMVFAYSEDELEEARDKLEQAKNNIPDWLNDPKAKIKDIKYGGDIKGKH